jgi:hypothetical protein
MCRAARVLCVAENPASLVALKRAAVAAEWELCPGATEEAAALSQMASEHPDRVVVFGPFEGLIADVVSRYPWVTVVSDRDAPGAVVATSLAEVRGLLMRPRPGGPIGGTG